MNKNVEKVIKEFSELGKIPKIVLQTGSRVFISIIMAGTLLITFNHLNPVFNTYIEFAANSLVKTSFAILAETVIGGLLLDYAIKRKEQ